MAAGFIHDKLEIKFLILYIAARVSEPLPPEGMQELTMCDDRAGTDGGGFQAISWPYASCRAS